MKRATHKLKIITQDKRCCSTLEGVIVAVDDVAMAVVIVDVNAVVLDVVNKEELDSDDVDEGTYKERLSLKCGEAVLKVEGMFGGDKPPFSLKPVAVVMAPVALHDEKDTMKTGLILEDIADMQRWHESVLQKVFPGIVCHKAS